MSLNCAALPKDLLEAELFGAERVRLQEPLKSRQDWSSRLLVEPSFWMKSEMDLSVQPKLLRFLETRRARRIGGEREYSVSCVWFRPPTGIWSLMSEPGSFVRICFTGWQR